MLAALPVLAGVLATIPTPPSLAWPTVAGLGGAAGRLLAASGLAAGREVLGPVGALLVWTIGLALAVSLTLLVLGLSPVSGAPLGASPVARCTSACRAAAVPPEHCGGCHRGPPGTSPLWTACCACAAGRRMHRHLV